MRTASLGFPGVKKRRKNEFYIQKIEFYIKGPVPVPVADFYSARSARMRATSGKLSMDGNSLRSNGFSVLRIFLIGSELWHSVISSEPGFRYLE